jgi:hypothetical protein
VEALTAMQHAAMETIGLIVPGQDTPAAPDSTDTPGGTDVPGSGG